MKYYILLGIYGGTANSNWEMLFGDYAKACVLAEKSEYKDTGEYRQLKVIELANDLQKTVDAKVREMQALENRAQERRLREQIAEIMQGDYCLDGIVLSQLKRLKTELAAVSTGTAL